MGTNPLMPEKAIEQLKALGIEISTRTQLEALDLPEPAYGEQILGELNDDEAAVFQELFHLNMLIETRRREYVADSLGKLGQSLREGTERDLSADQFKIPEAVEREVHRMMQQAAMLHAMLYWRIGERFDCHEWRLGVRSRGRIVKIERR